LRGELASARNPKSARRAENIWIRESGLPDDVPLQEHLEAIASFVASREEALASLADDVTYTVWLAFASESGQGGFALDPESFQILSRLRIGLVVSLYPPES
jgi:hypothetical protein